MRGVALAVLAAALTAVSSSFAAPDRSSATSGWRYGAISGTATMTVTSPRLTCTPTSRAEKRVVRGTYRVSFTGTSMRRSRAAADIEYSPVAGGPAGNTQPIAFNARRTIEELVHVRTITFNDLGEPICTLEERSCTSSDSRPMRNFGNRLNVWMRPGGRVRINPPHALAFGTCAPDATDWDLLLGDTFGEMFPIGVFNSSRAVLRFASTSRGRGQTETGAAVTAMYVYRASIGIRRLPGTPLVRCKVC
jgi:hypothetical protein